MQTIYFWLSFFAGDIYRKISRFFCLAHILL